MNKFDEKLLGKENKRTRNLNDRFFKNTDPNRADDKTVIELNITELYSFSEHPFKVKDDDSKMIEMIDSIKEQGIINPIIVRKVETKEGFEIIAGHRRTRACKLLEIQTIPAIIKKLDDEESTILMVDSNIQREELLFSEKAFAYKMKLDAIKRTAGRPKNNCAQLGYNYEGKKSIEIISDENSDSRNQIQRYIRLTELIPELLDMTDNKKLPFTTSVELSYLSREEQSLVFNKIKEFRKPSLKEAKQLKEVSATDGITEEFINNLLSDNSKNKTENLENKPLKKLLLKNKVLEKYFNQDVDEKELQETFLTLLELYHSK